MSSQPQPTLQPDPNNPYAPKRELTDAELMNVVPHSHDHPDYAPEKLDPNYNYHKDPLNRGYPIVVESGPIEAVKETWEHVKEKLPFVHHQERQQPSILSTPPGQDTNSSFSSNLHLGGDSLSFTTAGRTAHPVPEQVKETLDLGMEKESGSDRSGNDRSESMSDVRGSDSSSRDMTMSAIRDTSDSLRGMTSSSSTSSSLPSVSMDPVQHRTVEAERAHLNAGELANVHPPDQPHQHTSRIGDFFHKVKESLSHGLEHRDDKETLEKTAIS